MQLDGCLRSLRLHAAEPVEVCVLWRGSTPRMRNAYDQLRAEHHDVAWIEERDFERDVRALLADAGKHVMFVVDDTIFTGDFSPVRCAALLDNAPNAIGFSLRLGLNTTHCYPMDRAQQMPIHAVFDDVMALEWIGADGDFGYPLEVSSSIYRTADIIALLDGEEGFRNPNELEALLAERCSSGHFGLPRAKALRPHLRCFSQSVAFSLPCNRVQNQFANRVGGGADTTADALLERWERGERMAVLAYHGRVSTGCHEAAPFVTTMPTSFSDMSSQGYGIGGDDHDASGERGGCVAFDNASASAPPWCSTSARTLATGRVRCSRRSRTRASIASTRSTRPAPCPAAPSPRTPSRCPT
jgi:hypothetical protein